MSRTIRRHRKTGKPERDTYHRRTHMDPSCRHHGSCPYCENGRLHAAKRRAPIEEAP
jgi:hypothetical protein